MYSLHDFTHTGYVFAVQSGITVFCLLVYFVRCPPILCVILLDSVTVAACDCDPVGTENKGECDMRNDLANGLIAGKCKCKTNVGGTRCETCEMGYWDFTEDGCRGER